MTLRGLDGPRALAREASRNRVVSARKYRNSLASLTVTAPVAITTAARGPGSAFWLRRSAP
jgi:hypothetical protein